MRHPAYSEQNPERMEYLNFTTPYFITQYVILGRGSSWFDKGLADMKGKTMAVVRGYKMEEDLRRDHPDIKLMVAETMEEALFMVHEGKALPRYPPSSNHPTSFE